MIKYYEQNGKKMHLSKHTNVTLFGHEFSKNLKSLLIWTVSVAAVMVLVILAYPMFADIYPQLIASMAPEMQEIFTAIGGEFTNVLEYYAVEGGQVFVLAGAIYAVILAIKFVRDEITNGTYEFLYSQPVNRMKIFRSKALVLTLNLFLFNLVITLASYLTIYFIEGNVNIVNFLLYSAFSYLLQLQIGFIAFSLSAILKRKMSIGLGISVAVLGYFIGVFYLLSSIVPKLAFLQYLTPFQYILNGLIVDGISAVNMVTLAVWSGISLVIFAISHIQFKRTDLI